MTRHEGGFHEASLDAFAAPGRRAFLTGLTGAAVWCLGVPAAGAAASPRVATLDWALFETLLALGANVVAAPELAQYREAVVSPPAGPEIADLGLRGSPSLERLPGLRPDIIFNSNFYAWADPLLERIAPVESLSVYVPGQDPWLLAEKAARAMDERLALGATQALIGTLDERIGRTGQSLRSRGIGPVLPVNLGDARHLRVFGTDSLFGAALKRLGVANAWDGPTQYSAMAPVGVETLAAMPDAFVVFIGPQDRAAMNDLRQSALWRALPQAKTNRFIEIAPVNPYGGLPSASRFVRSLAEGLGVDAH